MTTTLHPDEKRTDEPEIVHSDLADVAPRPFDVARVRSDFPILRETLDSKTLVYLDNGASTQKPNRVLERLQTFYSSEYANIHRGVHTLSQRATFEYEKARATVRDFLGRSPRARDYFRARRDRSHQSGSVELRSC
jgi:hypothetical protein